MELLAVVALLAIVAAITAPALAPILRGTEIARLDGYAKEIYVALQDQFIDMEASGEYVQFNRVVAGAASERNLGVIGAQPHDAEDGSWQAYSYLTSFGAFESANAGAADAALADVMARTSIVDGLTSGGRYIVEVSPRSDGTDVYSVFYSEDPDFSYADVRGLASRDRADRMNTGRGYPVGYYNGVAATGADMPDRFAPRATFVNGEELFLNVKCAGGFGLIGSEQNMVVKVNLSDGTHEQTIVFVGGQDFRLDTAGNLDIDIVIDSLRDGMHLADIFSDFTPGADITALVEVEYSDGSVTVSTPASLRGQAKANSLYARNTGGYIQVANVRHLSNLSLLPDTAAAVSQVLDIDFDAKSWGRSEATQLSRATKDYNEDVYGTAFVNPIDPRTVSGASGFVPLEPQTAWPYDGSGNVLRNFVVYGSGATGLFAHVLEGQLVANTTIVDAIVEGGGSTGALVGELYGQVENCGVRLDVSSAADTGKADTYKVISSGGGNVGGLVGFAGGSASINRSYGAVDVVASSASAVGGLVGRFASSGYLTGSYASGSVDAADVAGGLVGSLEGGVVENCYSTSDVYANGTAGGFVGNAGAGSISSCVSYGRVSAPSVGGFTGTSGAAFADCAYLSQVGYNEATLDQPEGIVAKDYASLSATRLAADHSHPYRDSLLGKAFPFAAVLEDHWGNWPAPSNLNPVLVYYERYGDGTYGYYGMGSTPESIVEINTLDDTFVVEEDGYALLSTYPIRGFDYVLNGGATYRVTLGSAVGPDTYVELPSEGMQYWDGSAYQSLDEKHVYQLPFPLLMPERAASRTYDTLEITFAGLGGGDNVSYTYYYNPDFAKLASSPDAFGSTAAPDTSTLLLRTARHLNRLGHQPGYWNASIAQDRDIDFVFYTRSYLGFGIDYTSTGGSYANTPIGTSGTPFTGTFDGRNFAIVDYSLYADGAQEAGLFGYVTGTVRNVHLATSVDDAASIVRTGSARSGSTLAVGGLVGWLDGGTVSGSSVSGYQVFCESSTAVSDAGAGGLVGVNSGTVSASSAADVTLHMYPASTSGATLGVGGLVGSTQGSITRCYAVENEYDCQTTTSGADRVIAYGGIAGYVYAGSPRIADCYAYGFVSATACAPDDYVVHHAIAHPDWASVSNCYTMEVYSGAEAGGAAVVEPYELQDAPLAGFAGSSTPRNTYGETSSGHVIQSRDNYPYPVICKDAYGEWTHYGFSYR